MASRGSCLERVGLGVVAGAALGLAAGACVGTFEAYKHKIPGLLKIRHIGQTTLLAAATCGIFLGSSSLIHCGDRY